MKLEIETDDGWQTLAEKKSDGIQQSKTARNIAPYKEWDDVLSQFDLEVGFFRWHFDKGYYDVYVEYESDTYLFTIDVDTVQFAIEETISERAKWMLNNIRHYIETDTAHDTYCEE